jgi:hypothetical protein
MSGKICIHGHFYQPSREDPWTGIVEREPSAAPWHDWNQRICEECYRPNTAARILDGQGLIETTLSTYSRISCDFGPTLLAWLERESPAVYEAVLHADRSAKERFSGHGSALAHPFHHIILPLLPQRDKVTEIRWGIRDFEDRFGRYPEGMWLPEMAVDRETLEVLADHDIRFTMLAPHQVRRLRPAPGEDRADTTDPGTAGTCRLPSGREIAVFIHDAALCHEVAFGTLLENGDRFADRLLAAASGGGLVHVATDGETFGHHRKFGDMALAWCIRRLEADPSPLTIYGEYLEQQPSFPGIDIIERTSWSCPHGISRWDEGCDCTSGRHTGWSHAWRGPLRSALAGLAQTLRELYAREAAPLFTDPWSARDDCISLIRDPSPGSCRQFMEAHAGTLPPADTPEKACMLLELSRQCLAMQTSCALFFDDIGDREAVQALRHAARALQIAREISGTDHETLFRSALSRIPGNRPHLPDGDAVYTAHVLPHILPPHHQAACLALEDIRNGRASLSFAQPGTGDFIEIGELVPVHDLSFAGRRIRYCMMGTGMESVLLGVTSEAGILSPEVCADIFRMFRKRGYPVAGEELRRVCFPPPLTLPDLMPAGRRLVIRSQLGRMQDALDEAESIIFDRYTGLVREGQEQSGLDPGVFRLARSVLTRRMRLLLADPGSTTGDLADLAGECVRWGVSPEQGEVRVPGESFLMRLAGDWAAHPEDRERLDRVVQALGILHGLPVPVQLWDLQNLFLLVRDGPAGPVRGKAAQGEPGALAWQEQFLALGSALRVRSG